VVASSAAAAGRSVLEEIIMLEEGLLSPVTFAAVTCAFSTTFLCLFLVAAQLLPGQDHGVKVSCNSTT
jgi:hypothetical protein